MKHTFSARMVQEEWSDPFLLVRKWRKVFEKKTRWNKLKLPRFHPWHDLIDSLRKVAGWILSKVLNPFWVVSLTTRSADCNIIVWETGRTKFIGKKLFEAAPVKCDQIKIVCATQFSVFFISKCTGLSLCSQTDDFPPCAVGCVPEGLACRATHKMHIVKTSRTDKYKFWSPR